MIYIEFYKNKTLDATKYSSAVCLRRLNIQANIERHVRLIKTDKTFNMLDSP